MFSNGEKVRLFSDDKVLQGGVETNRNRKENKNCNYLFPCNGGILIVK